ncbi:hypothetical protein Cch01nite_26590 [Cellulomonas chitinilytica]|uniref:Uncharacterized protein n=1 Tax=Cellulomonas chitinilytica TaxID=398759 RepID=A0A919TZM7_9CELL|nr:hypothetical protein [Cellulomonas chitinilytica]GIG21935.1 hypothetical protein Cch01nite_26590 [Cellulomonas chitinilytica]
MRLRPGAPVAPEVDVRLGACVSTVGVRAALGVLGGLLVLVAFTTTGAPPPPVVVGGFAVLVVATAVRPRAVLPGLLVGLVGLRVLLTQPPPLIALMALVLLVHLVLWCAAVAARTSSHARVEVAVLGAMLRDVAWVQAGAQVLTVGAVVLSGATLAGGDVLRVVAIVGAMLAAGLVRSRPAESWWQRR